ncbi:MAG: hypothetical protein P8175_15235, partial [Deltaproteobacteria bacterium]
MAVFPIFGSSASYMGFFKNKDFSRFVPVGWVRSLDVMRGLAILLMTLPHQTLLFDLQNSFPGDTLFLIGVYYACYGIAALTGCLGFGIRRFAGLALLVMVWFAFPPLRPNDGLFPIWPHGVYFLSGYLLAVYATSRFHRAESTLIALALSISYVGLFFQRYVPDLLKATLPAGVILTIAVIFLTSAVILLAENRNYMTKPLFAFLLRFGRYPLTLYFAQ